MYQSPSQQQQSQKKTKKENPVQNLSISNTQSDSEEMKHTKTITQEEALALSEKLYNQRKDYKLLEEQQEKYTFQPEIIEYKITKQHENQRYKQYTLEAQEKRKQLENKNNKSNTNSYLRSSINKSSQLNNSKQQDQNEQNNEQIDQSQKTQQQHQIQIPERLQKQIDEYTEAAKNSKEQLEKHKEEQVKEQLKECTFKPKINNFKLSSEYAGDAIDRFQKLERVRQARIRIQKEKQEQQELEKCTFKPQINENYKLKQSMEPASERLYALSKKQPKIEQPVDLECTFHPQINQQSQQIYETRYTQHQNKQKEKPQQDQQQKQQNNEKLLEQLYNKQQPQKQYSNTTQQQNLFIQVKVKKYFMKIVQRILEGIKQSDQDLYHVIEQMQLSPATNTILNQVNMEMDLTDENQQKYINKCVQVYNQLNIKFMEL